MVKVFKYVYIENILKPFDRPMKSDGCSIYNNFSDKGVVICTYNDKQS